MGQSHLQKILYARPEASRCLAIDKMWIARALGADPLSEGAARGKRGAEILKEQPKKNSKADRIE